MINQLSSQQVGFSEKLLAIVNKAGIFDKKISEVVDKIINDVRVNGDEAVLKYSRKFDNTKAKSIADLNIAKKTLKNAFDTLAAKEKNALQTAKKRIYNYHIKQKQTSWHYQENKTMLGQKITPLDKVGLYTPGGKAAYPSSVLMNVIPAKIAGVLETIMMVPTKSETANKMVLAAAYITKVDKVFAIGGAQAIAALAYGTESITKVDKIVGPGNIYVATAKRAVFGKVGIDMIAGPSEILIICDGNTNPDWIAMDLFAQAEHDKNAQAILLCPDANFIKQVKTSIKKLLPTMSRKNIIAASLKNKGVLITTKDINDAVAISNTIAPEHLELAVDKPKKLLKHIKHAGAIFLGPYSCEALGDYCAGPNHVLPTAGTARFASPLGVYDFQKRSSIIMVSREDANTLGGITATLAHSEGLEAHAKSALYRTKE